MVVKKKVQMDHRILKKYWEAEYAAHITMKAKIRVIWADKWENSLIACCMNTLSQTTGADILLLWIHVWNFVAVV